MMTRKITNHSFMQPARRPPSINEMRSAYRQKAEALQAKTVSLVEQLAPIIAEAALCENMHATDEICIQLRKDLEAKWTAEIDAELERHLSQWLEARVPLTDTTARHAIVVRELADLVRHSEEELF